MSNLEFKFGSEDNPKGHAIIYFEEFDEIFASYVINFPIKGELSKYIPEMFKDQIPDEEMTKMVFPPVPEKFNGNLDSLIKITQSRADDLIYGGSINSNDTTSAMSKLNALANEYSKLCTDNEFNEIKELIDDIPSSEIELENSKFSEMNESELLAEVTKIFGKIKFSKDNNEIDEISNIKKDLQIISTIIPENRKIKKLLDYVELESNNSEEIISAYISRAYGLMNEDYIMVKEQEDLIKKLEKW